MSSVGSWNQEWTVVKWNYQILGLHQATVHQKLGVILVIKWFKNWSQQKMLFTKKVCLNWYSSKNFSLKDLDDFWHRKFTLKVQNWHFLTNCHQTETQNLVISFDYSWFMAKNFAYAECPIMKFHDRNSSTAHPLGSDSPAPVSMHHSPQHPIDKLENSW